MNHEEKTASARRARDIRASKARRPALPLADDALPRPRKTRGLVGVRKLAVGILQQQLESLRDRRLGMIDREFLIEAVKALIGGEKVQKQPMKEPSSRGSTGEHSVAPLPALDSRPTVGNGVQTRDIVKEVAEPIRFERSDVPPNK